MEARFGITVSEDDFNPEHLLSIDSLIAFIGKKTNAASHAVV